MKANTLILYVKTNDNYETEVQEAGGKLVVETYPIEIDENKNFFLKQNELNRFNTILNLIEFYINDRLVEFFFLNVFYVFFFVYS